METGGPNVFMREALNLVDHVVENYQVPLTLLFIGYLLMMSTSSQFGYFRISGDAECGSQ